MLYILAVVDCALAAIIVDIAAVRDKHQVALTVAPLPAAVASVLRFNLL
jgi:hypothetical protein